MFSTPPSPPHRHLRPRGPGMGAPCACPRKFCASRALSWTPRARYVHTHKAGTQGEGGRLSQRVAWVCVWGGGEGLVLA